MKILKAKENKNDMKCNSILDVNGVSIGSKLKGASPEMGSLGEGNESAAKEFHIVYVLSALNLLW